jgi:inhibitor of cysteine peptidase
MTGKILTIDDTGKTQSFKVGELITMKLPENPTTGFNWEIKEFDKKILELTDTQYEIVEDVQIGGGGTKTFKFKLKSPGSTRIKLILKRSMDPDSSAIQYFEAIITVN